MYDIELGNRIKEARIRASLSQLEISEKIGKTDKTYREYEKGKKITIEILRKIADITNTNFYYLIDGDKALEADHINPKQDIATNYNNLVVATAEENKAFIKINFYPDVYAAAGGGAINGNSNAVPMTFDKGFLESLGLKQFKNLDMIKVTGDSMEPFIQNGEMVILERKDEAQNNDVVVANINGQVYIKRYEADPFFKWIKLKSENEFSGDILLENQEEMNALSIIGIVRAKIKPF